MSIMVATGQGAKRGVLFKNAEAIELLRKVDVLIVDKTGTITEGKPKLAIVKTFGQIDEAEVLKLAASLKHKNKHPLAATIVQKALNKKLTFEKIEHFQSITGKRTRATVGGRDVAIGNRTLMADLNVALERTDDIANELRKESQTVMFMAIENHLVGIIGVADPVKETAPEAIRALHESGLRIIMLTGDNKNTAEAVARKVHIDEVIADVLPHQKAEAVRKIQSSEKIVAMAGDGINDAPALAQADVGIAMGTGTDVAMKSAGVTLVKGDLKGIVSARELSNATIRNIKQNLFFAFIYNALGVPVAAGILYPFFGVLLSPMLAAFAMSLSSVSVIGNSLRLKRTG
jgi:Cu+-exporting ATPase